MGCCCMGKQPGHGQQLRRDEFGGASMPDSNAHCVDMCSALRPRERIQSLRERRDDRDVVARGSEGVFTGWRTSPCCAGMASSAWFAAETALEDGTPCPLPSVLRRRIQALATVVHVPARRAGGQA